jgi:dTDP-glucose pyrophosphorylase
MIQNIIQDMIDAGYKFYAVKIEGEYHDTGNPQDYEDYWKSV